MEIQRQGEKRCKSLEETRDLVRRLDTKAKEYFEKVGCQVSGKLLAKSFWQAMDEHTLELAENRDLRLEDDCYKELREFTLRRFERRQARSTTAAREVIAAVDDPGQEKEKETDDQGEDALYSSPKGKGKNGKALECWTCGGRGHPSRLCPSDATSPSAITCNECGEKGHNAMSCPSGKGGGSKGKGKDNGKGTPWTGQGPRGQDRKGPHGSKGERRDSRAKARATARAKVSTAPTAAKMTMAGTPGTSTVMRTTTSRAIQTPRGWHTAQGERTPVLSIAWGRHRASVG